MKHAFFAVFSLCTAALTSLPAFACEEHAAQKAAAEERVTHYAVETPKSTEAALKLLQDKTEEIGALMANATLDGNHMETIHEKTYSLEAAVDKLRAENHAASATALDAADEAVQALHYASENHEQGESRKWYESLKPAVEGVKAAYAPTAASSGL